MPSIKTDKLSFQQKVNSIIYRQSPFQDQFPRMQIIRLVTMRVLLFKQLASKQVNKIIKNPFTLMPNLQIDLLPNQRQFYQQAIYGSLTKTSYKSDCYSHFVCRMAFCQNQGLRDYMVKHQATIFRNKIQRQSIQLLLSLHDSLTGLNCKLQSKVSETQFNTHIGKINACRDKKIQTREQILKMPFQMASQVYKFRQAYLLGGYAYFDKQSFKKILTHCYQKKLKSDLQQITQKVQKFLQNDKQDQLTSFLKEMGSLNLQSDYDFDKMKGKLTAKNIQFWSKCFPPCMNHLYSNLKNKHHLKHGGRLQLGLFLKGAGLALDQALLFWKNAFEESGKNFQKQYMYNIKHNYGKQGAKKSYNPMGCELIIKNSDPKVGEYHGCPFKTHGTIDLKYLLKQNYKINQQQYNQIQQLHRKKHYQVACRLLFQLSNKEAEQNKINKIGTHPNLYFQQSIKLQQQKLNKKIDQQII